MMLVSMGNKLEALIFCPIIGALYHLKLSTPMYGALVEYHLLMDIVSLSHSLIAALGQLGFMC